MTGLRRVCYRMDVSTKTKPKVGDVVCEAMNEPDCCEACGLEYDLRENNDPSRFCDPCAQTKLVEAFALLAEIQRRNEAAIARIQADFPGYREPEPLIELRGKIEAVIGGSR